MGSENSVVSIVGMLIVGMIVFGTAVAIVMIAIIGRDIQEMSRRKRA